MIQAAAKKTLDDLALFGGAPTFAEPLHVGRPHVRNPERLEARIRRMLADRWFTNDGPLVRELEARVAALIGVEHCVAVSNGTAGLEILARAARLEGEVLVPSFTFVGTAHAMLWAGLTPRFCDVDPATHTLDPARVAETISPATSAILAVHVWGRACAVDELRKLATENGLRLLYDAAHASACSHRGRPIGGFGDAEVFSFHATKVLQAFEGGAITTNDGKLAERARLLRNFGFSDYDTVVGLGTNAKMSEASAAMGLTSLDALEETVAANRANHEHYREQLAGLPGVKLVEPDPNDRWNYHYVVLELDAEAGGLDRNQLHRLLWAEGVLARRYFYPGVHALEPYRTLDPHAGEALPETEALVTRVLCLPTGNAVGPGEIDRVCDLVRLGLEHAPEIRRRLGRA